MRFGGLYRKKRHHRFRALPVKDHGAGTYSKVPAPVRILKARKVRTRAKNRPKNRSTLQERLKKRRQRLRRINKGLSAEYNRPVLDPKDQARACRMTHVATCGCRGCRLGRRLGI